MITENSKTLVIMTQEDLHAFAVELLASAQLQEHAPEKRENDVLNTEEAAKYLHVSTRTLQTYRDKKVIPFSQYGRKITFLKSDLEAFLDSKKIS